MTRHNLTIAILGIAVVFCAGVIAYQNSSIQRGIAALGINPSSLTSSVAEPLTLSFWADQTSVPYKGSTKLHWTLNTVASCAYSGGMNFSLPLSVIGATGLDPLTSSQTYTLTCTAQGMKVSKTLTISVIGSSQPSPLPSITPTPSQTPTPTPTVVVPAPTLSLTATPTSISPGQSASLNWASDNTTSCNASGGWSGVQNLIGGLVLTPVTNSQTYTLTCSGAGGKITKSVKVSVAETPAKPLPSITLTATPGSIANGGSTTLTWSSTNATSCAATSGWSGPKATAGQMTLANVTSSKVYSLSCTGPGGTTTRSVSVAVASLPKPTISASVSEPIVSPTLAGAAPLHATFDINLGLHRSWDGLGGGGIPDLYNPDEGAFRFTCGGEGKASYSDPVVFPGQANKSHLHQPWGNTAFSANTTPASLAANLDSNCNYGPNTLNRSSYWEPALINDKGQVIHPDLVSVYYKRKTSASSFCTPGSKNFMGICVGLPNQIRFVFGWDSHNPTAPVQGASWYCTTGNGKHYHNLDDLFNSGCVANGKSQIIADTIAPNCWDGKYLDTADHRSHMAYGSYGSWGYYKCPADHPYVIPQEENKATFTVTSDMIGTNADGTHYSRIKLSSDFMMPGAKPGATLHADYMESWVQEAKNIWLNNCIEKALNCSGGDLGNGQMLNKAAQPSYGWTNPNPREWIPGPSSGAPPTPMTM